MRGRLARRQCDVEHKVCRVAGSGEGAAPCRRVVQGTRVQAVRAELRLSAPAAVLVAAVIGAVILNSAPPPSGTDSVASLMVRNSNVSTIDSRSGLNQYNALWGD